MPADLNSFCLDLQTKQTIMMQACVKMYTAVEQQTLDVFINVFSSLFSSALYFSYFGCERGGESLLQSCRGKYRLRIQAAIKMCRFCLGSAKSNFPRDDCRRKL